MKVAIICEYSGTVRDAFAALGNDAISFDILPTETPGEHYQGDILQLPREYWEQFDLAVCHPPCTHLAVSGARHFKSKLEKNPNIQKDALDFVQYLMDLPIERIAIENPVSIISSRIRKPEQIVQPWMFGHPERKTTCLWLKNLPLLVPTSNVEEEMLLLPKNQQNRIWYMGSGKGKERSKFYPGIAQAMASQWSISLVTN